MTHRAEQIVDAIVAAIAAQANLGVNSENVYAHRTLSLADDQGEMDAITVNIGDDEPMSEFGNDSINLIDSLLQLSVVGYVIADTEPLCKTSLFNVRRRIHQALLADQTLGLTFVPGIRYGGAGAPQLDGSTKQIVGSLESRWFVHYRMNVTDPGD